MSRSTPSSRRLVPLDDLAFYEPALIGWLAFDVAKGRPRLFVRAWCPFCRRFHSHKWPNPPFNPKGAMKCRALCRTGPFAGYSYHVALDPKRRPGTDKLLALYAKARAERRAQRQQQNP